jgi:hypothetical protein
MFSENESVLFASKLASKDYLSYETRWEYLSSRRTYPFNPRFKHDIFRLLIIFKSKCFNDKIVDGIKNVVDIRSLLYGVA